jgi:hypothetical protein
VRAYAAFLERHSPIWDMATPTIPEVAPIVKIVVAGIASRKGGMAYVGTGWRLIGIIASVILFFGFGVFLWNRSVEDAVAPYARDLRICSALEQYSDKFLQENARECALPLAGRRDFSIAL